MAAKNDAKSTSSKSWQGRLKADTDALTAEFVASIDIDHELYSYDIAGSIVHAQMLSEQKIITKKEFAEIKKGLKSIAEDIAAGKMPMPVELEDIHMVIESALTKRIGEAGKKLHTGRSRNDQVALDMRLYVRDAIEILLTAVRQLQKAFVKLAQKQGEIVIPSYTHLQRAQPTVAGHAMMAYVEMLERDAQRFEDCHKRVNVCPLGSGAVAGTSIDLDRERTAELLGFAEVGRNSIDMTSDRDFLSEFCFVCATLGGHLSRWAEDWIIQSSSEFSFIELSDAYCTSSSMMPQKKNPDTLELIRGKSATTIAQLVGMLTLTKALPLAYNRDLQDDKRFVIAAFKAMRQSLAVAEGIVSTARFRQEKISDGLDQGFLDATALAEYLVNKGVAFRQAHHIVGSLVSKAEETEKALAELELSQMQAACAAIEPDVYEHLGAKNVVKNYKPIGAGGIDQLNSQIAFWSEKLK